MACLLRHYRTRFTPRVLALLWPYRVVECIRNRVVGDQVIGANYKIVYSTSLLHDMPCYCSPNTRTVDVSSQYKEPIRRERERGEMEKSSFARNRYWILRHGRSIPNERGLIVSSLDNGVLEEFQLASEGINQAQAAGLLFQKELKENNIALENVRICYSPFSRTSHTAKVVSSVLTLPFEGPQCKVMAELRERFFGPSFELQSHDKYTDIWALDENDPFIGTEGGESVADVFSRLGIAMEALENEFQGCAILIVSHGDPLQILQTILHAAKELNGLSSDMVSRIQATKVPSILSQHRKFALQTGELRSIL